MGDTTAYITTIGQHDSKVTLEDKEEQISINVDGEEHEVDWRMIAPLVSDERGRAGEGGRYHLVIGERSYEVYARRLENAEGESGNRYEILLGGQHFIVGIEDERTRLLTGKIRAGANSNTARINAPMPGLVIGTPLAAGSQVVGGQTVVVLEAMKMENDLASPINGTLKELRVHTGQTVEQGQVLVVIEGEKSA